MHKYTKGKKTNSQKLPHILGRVLLFIGCIEFVVFLLLVAWSNQTFRNTIVLATTVKPETFTELYFENHTKLPSTVILNTPYSFSFTIHNLENKDLQYPYEIFVQIGDQKQIIEAKTVAVKNGAYLTIPETFSLAQPISTKGEVVVHLMQQNQQINFWVTSDQTVTPTPTASTHQFQVNYIYGAWYWNSALQKSQLWLGKDKKGNDIWGDTLPVNKNTGTKT